MTTEMTSQESQTVPPAGDYQEILKIAMKYQPIINIGMVGHVANGKSCIVKALTGIETPVHSTERQKNITIKLGYANVKIYRCPTCPAPEGYQTGPSNEFEKLCVECATPMELATHVSFVDCPGHLRFMSTMLNGTSIMDTTILVEANNNDTLPAPQTMEHLKALTIGKIPNSIVCLNKVDIKREKVLKNLETLRQEFEGTVVEDSAVVPLSATLDINVDVLRDYIAQIPPPIRDLARPCRMIVVRSFNINNPGTQLPDLKGGVVGGSLLCGLIRVGDEVELRPGYCTENTDKTDQAPRWKCRPLCAKVLSLESQRHELPNKYAIPGGLIGLQLDIDPALTANDGLIGQLVTPVGKGDPVYEDVAISYELLDEDLVVNKGDTLQLNINACNTTCQVIKLCDDPTDGNILKLRLERPVSVSVTDRVTICSNGRIFGTGRIIEGKASEITRNGD